MVIQCCVCGRMRADGRWVKKDDHSHAGQDVSHGYCPKCAHKAFNEIRMLHAKAAVAGRT